MWNKGPFPIGARLRLRSFAVGGRKDRVAKPSLERRVVLELLE